MKTTVIHHSADYDGIFCREIARKFLPDAELIGWDFPDKPLSIPDGQIYILDLPVDRVFGFTFPAPDEVREVNHLGIGFLSNIVWIDHHKSAIESHPQIIPGYRIDGVAACRLAWQWFTQVRFANKQDFLERNVLEPLAVRLAGEYDIWDHRGDGDLEFQFGLDTIGPDYELQWLLSSDDDAEIHVKTLIHRGETAMRCYAKRDADIMRSRSFLVEWEGLKFLALNTARCNSNTFAARDVPETGHDALMALCYDGKLWNFSLYHAAHRKDLDLSQIAVKHGGGGHRGACGFRAKTLVEVGL